MGLRGHDVVIDRSTRGLSFHHFGCIVTLLSTIKSCWFHSLPEIDDVSLYRGTIGNGDFVYHYNTTDNTDNSIWLYQFYSGHWSGAYIHDQIDD